MYDGLSCLEGAPEIVTPSGGFELSLVVYPWFTIDHHLNRPFNLAYVVLESEYGDSDNLAIYFSDCARFFKHIFE